MSSHALDMKGVINGNTLNLDWTDCRRSQLCARYVLKIEKCPEDCFTIETKDIEVNHMTLKDKIFQDCTLYHFRLDAISETSQRVFSDELTIRKKLRECNYGEDIILSVGFTLLCLFLVAAVIAAFYYHKKHPIHRFQRARSRVYSKIYSPERYHQPIRKSEFVTTLNKILNEPNHMWKPDLRKKSIEKQDPEDLGHEAEKLERSKPFGEEFERLERLAFDTIQRRTSVASLPVSTRRNRYNDIVPFDATRVRIIPPYSLPGDIESSDYINASFISDTVSGQTRRCIAAQGPGEETTPAFWEMIWLYDVRVIVMLTNLVEGHGFNCIKCDMYWPAQLGDRKRYNDIDIQLFDAAEAPSYIVRKFDVTHRSADVNKVIVQIQFTNWRDRSAPSDPHDLLQLVQLSRVMYNQFSPKDTTESSPLLVHCSAGVGRTGTFICVDQMMRAVDNRQTVDLDIFNTIYQLRRDRMYMVQTRAQYEYVYKCVAAYITIKEEQKEKASTRNSPA